MSEVKNIETSKSSVGSVTLPSGFLDENGNLHKAVDLREISGEEEDILSSKKMSVAKRLQKVIANCITGWDGIDPSKYAQAVRSLPVVDKIYLLIQLRALSLGADYTFEVKCPNEACRAKSRQTIDLSGLDVEGLKDPLKRVHESTLPRSGHVVRWKIMDGEAEERITGMKQHESVISLAIYARILEIDGEPPKSIKQISKWSLRDRDFMRGEFIEHEGNIDTMAEIECPSCGEEWETPIAIDQPGFFFPQASSKRLKTI